MTFKKKMQFYKEIFIQKIAMALMFLTKHMESDLADMVFLKAADMFFKSFLNATEILEF